MTLSGCVTVDPLYDPTDFTPGGGDTGTVLISPLIKPGTVSNTYYNHYSTLRTLEDLLLTGQTCTNPSNADTPLVAGTVCGGLDGAGHIGYAAQPGLAAFGPDVFTAESFQPVGQPPGYWAVSGFGSGSSTLYCPIISPLGRPGQNGQPGHGSNGGTGGTGGSPGCGASGGNGGNGGDGVDRPQARAATAARAATVPVPPEEWSAACGSPQPVPRRRRWTLLRATACGATVAPAATVATVSARTPAATEAAAATARPASQVAAAPTVPTDNGVARLLRR